jgi:N-acetylmuramoyl-L-alanine amidase
MAVRAANLLAVLCALLLALHGAAEPARAAAPQSRAVDDFPRASQVRIGGNDAQTRFVMDFSDKIDIRAFTLAHPDRVVIDLPQVTFQLPPKTGQKGRGLIKAFRYGLIMRGGSRIVIDLAKPARIQKAFVLAPAKGQPGRLVLDLAATDRDSFMRAITLDNHATEVSHRQGRPIAKPSGDPRPLIVIDPGHGGIDNGTQAASGELEKTIVLEFSRLLREKIEKTGKYRVAMTRTDDTYVPLSDRVEFARARRASLFISIHADALPKREGDAQGATIYTLSETASDADAERLADSENRADVIAGLDLSAEPDDVADILIDLARRETNTFSMQFAHTVVADLKKAVRLHNPPIKSAGFRVLKAPDVPSILIELGFVSNKGDLKLLLADAWREKTAGTNVQAIDTYFSTRLAGRGSATGPD